MVCRDRGRFGAVGFRGVLPVVLVGVVLGALCFAGPVFGAGVCENEQLRAENGSAGLPDCRAYERVTPSYKGAYEFIPKFVSGGGSRVFAESFATVGGSGANPLLGASYQLDRFSEGWSTVPVSPPASSFPNGSFLGQNPAESPDGSTLWAANEGLNEIFVRNPDGSFTNVGPAGGGAPEYVGASQGFSHVVYSSFQGVPNLYEYVGSGNTEPILVGVSGGAGDQNPISGCGTYLGDSPFDVYNAVSAAGEIVYFTAAHGEKCGSVQPPVNELYARVAERKTVAISEPVLPAGEECTGVCEEDKNEVGGHHRSPGVFQGASSDGSRVFFLTSQPLLNSDEDNSNDLYMAEIEGAGESAAIGRLVQVSHDPTGGQPAGVLGVSRVSEDGSHVYFVASGVLTAGPNAEGAEPTLGADNLYVYDAAAPGIKFVATLSSSDSEEWSLTDGRPIQTTPNGSFLLFQSVANLTGDATEHTTQIYRYDSSSGELIRVSIGQEGFNANGITGTMSTPYPFYSIVDGLSNLGPSISDDGSYVFFQSDDGLTPGALNHVLVSNEHNSKHYANNVYEWHEGSVSLVSDGQDRTIEFAGESSVHLIGADPSGANVFFTTGDPLSPADTDDLSDLYDARIGGGFHHQSPPPPCSGYLCLHPPSAEPPKSYPSSAYLTGLGNFPPPQAVAPPGAGPPVRLSVAQVRARKLAKALRACRSRARSRRRGCEAVARKRYGAKGARFRAQSGEKSSGRGK